MYLYGCYIHTVSLLPGRKHRAAHRALQARLAENAALERGIAPDGWTKTNIARMKEQLQLMNGSWNWDRELTTCDPEFYKHTQKLFLMLLHLRKEPPEGSREKV